MDVKKIVLSLLLLSTTAVFADGEGQVAVGLEWLYLKPMSNNHTYAFYVAGTQPYFQDWHAQAVNPAYTSAWALNVAYPLIENQLDLAIDWLHVNSTDNDQKQGNQTLDLASIEFVGPPFEMSPPVFGIRHAEAKLKYEFDELTFSLEKILSTPAWLKAKIIPGINTIYLKQTLTSTFSDLVGSLPTAFTYPLPPDPSFSFQLQAISKFFGAGPSLGLAGELEIYQGLSLIGVSIASLNVGTISVQENFTATSAELTALGIGVSKQQATVPNKIQVVPAFDGKLGVHYQFKPYHQITMSIEAGYRIMTFINAISTLNPQTLVQPGDNPTVPEFSTGTMAIVAMTQQDRPFNLNGPYFAMTMRM